MLLFQIKHYLPRLRHSRAGIMDPSTSGLGRTRMRTNPAESGCEELPEAGGRAAQARRLVRLTSSSPICDLTLRVPRGTVTLPSFWHQNLKGSSRHVDRSQLQAPQGTVVFERGPLPDELFCPICSELLREACCPSHCGHWFCEECLKEHFSKNGGSCPICRTK